MQVAAQKPAVREELVRNVGNDVAVVDDVIRVQDLNKMIKGFGVKIDDTRALWALTKVLSPMRGHPKFSSFNFSGFAWPRWTSVAAQRLTMAPPREWRVTQAS